MSFAAHADFNHLLFTSKRIREHVRAFLRATRTLPLGDAVAGTGDAKSADDPLMKLALIECKQLRTVTHGRR